jgi:hypothetical protein
MAAGLNDTLLNIGNAAMQAAATHALLYTAEPNAAGTTNQSSAALAAITWDTAANGDMVLTTDEPFTGGASSGACTHVGLWDSGETTFYGYFALTGDQTFNAAGEYTLTGITITGTAS